MNRMLINAQTEQLRVAIVQDGLLNDLDIERPDVEQKKSNIYRGKISSIEPSLGAVFVNYGSERHGFLPVKEIAREYFLNNQDKESNLSEIDIKKALKIGQDIIVQVDKEERGTKGAALTTFISLAGSFLVLMPNNPRAGGISRRIEGEERDQLRNILKELKIPEGMGVIVRTAGLNRSQEELDWDLQVLCQYWDAIYQAAKIKPAPYLIHKEGDAIIRAIRDNMRQHINEIIIDTPEAFEHAKTYLQQARPNMVDRIKLYTNDLPLFSQFQVERQIEMAYQRELQLPSGGSIVIDHTEALVSIDINSARATKGSNIEETATQTNLEAAEEIARQLRIRDIGGLIVIDFIDMMQNRNQREVENKLREALRADRARIQINRISRFGLLEMSRQRLRSSLARSIHVTCPRCDGQGTIRGVESLALSIIHLIQEQAVKAQNIQIQVQVPIDIATYILNEKRHMLEDLEKRTNVQVLIIPNQYLQSPHYQIKHVKSEQINRVAPSYKLVKLPKVDGTTNKKMIAEKHREAEPAINEFLSTAPKAPTGTSSGTKTAAPGFLKKIKDIVFGPEEKSTTTHATQKPEPKNTQQSHRQSTGDRRRHNSGNTQSRNQNRQRTSNRQRPQNARNNNTQGKSQRQGQSRDDNRKSQGQRRRQGQHRKTTHQETPADTTQKQEPPKQALPTETPQTKATGTQTTPVTTPEKTVHTATSPAPAPVAKAPEIESPLAKGEPIKQIKTESTQPAARKQAVNTQASTVTAKPVETRLDAPSDTALKQVTTKKEEEK